MVSEKLKRIEIPSLSTYKLDRMVWAAALAGHPELGRKTILVAGTNGKGSTCAYLTHLFRGAGKKVGTYSSPHVISRTERIRINNRPIDESILRQYEARYKKLLEPLSYFERMTLLAFLIFRDHRVDVQVLEVGMGGRLDATNICAPDYSLICPVDYDHQEVLGNTLAKIATEKAGIMRPDRPCYLARQAREASTAIHKKAQKTGTTVFPFETHASELKKYKRLLENIYEKRGEHQFENAALALRVVVAAAKEWKWTLSPLAIRAAFQQPLWAARVQIIRKRPLFVVDGSHNPHAVASLRHWLDQSAPKLKFQCLFGVMEDKPALKLAEILSPHIESAHFPSFYPERELAPQQLFREWRSHKKLKAIFSQVVRDKKRWLLNAWNSDKPVLVVGSFYLAGEVLRSLKELKLYEFE